MSGGGPDLPPNITNPGEFDRHVVAGWAGGDAAGEVGSAGRGWWGRFQFGAYVVELCSEVLQLRDPLGDLGLLFGTLDPMRTYAGIDCPTLVVHSELDPIPAEWSRMLANTIPDADLALIEDAGHFAHIEDEQRVHDAVVPWLTKHAG